MPHNKLELLILGFRPANETRRYKETPLTTGLAKT